ncbi:hypothetical protein QUB25_12565, partial [Microcoleus sp. B3-D7]
MATSNNSFNSVIEASLQQAYSTLNNFANGDDFVTKVQSIFGTNFDAGNLEEIRQQWVNSDFGSLPAIEIRTGSELQGANAAYARSNNTIYVSQDFLNQNNDDPQAVTSVLLEEIGHSVDWHINTSDTPGDEGALFSATVLGQHLDASTLDAISQEDDSNILTLDNSSIVVEQSITTGTYSDGIDFGRYTFQAETADYIEKFSGIKIENEYNYDSEDNLILKTGYPGFEKTFFDEGGLKAGIKLEGGSFDAGFKAYAGLNLGEIDFDLPLQALLNASDAEKKLQFDFTTIFDAKLDYNIPSAYAVLDAVFDYNIGSLSASASIAGAGIEQTIFGGLSGDFTHRMVNINTLNDPAIQVNLLPGQVNFLAPSMSINTISLLGGLATFKASPLPNFNFSRENSSTEDQFSIKVSNQRPLDPEDITPGEPNPDPSLPDELARLTLNFDKLLAKIPQLSFLAQSIETGPFSVGYRLLPIELTGIVSAIYELEVGIRNTEPKIIAGEILDLATPYSELDELLAKDLDNDSKIDVKFELNPDVFFKPSFALDLETQFNVDIGRLSAKVDFGNTVFSNPLVKNISASVNLIDLPEIVIDELSSRIDIFKSDVSIPFNDLYAKFNGGVAPEFNKISVQIPFNAIYPNVGTAGDDVLSLPESAGVENLYGEAGNDVLYGNSYANRIMGAEDNDSIYGGTGNDSLYGEQGDDILQGEAGNNLLNGGIGIDTISYANSVSGVIVNIDENNNYGHQQTAGIFDLEPNFAMGSGQALDGFGSEDSIVGVENIVGSSFDDILIGNALDNAIEAGAGNDLVVSSAGNDRLEGNGGIDTVSFRRDPNGVYVSLKDGIATDGFGGQDNISGLENVVGSGFSDRIEGDDGVNIITSGGGNDFVDGLAGNDTIYAGTGNDEVHGGEDSDLLYGETGNDKLFGETGNDQLFGEAGSDTLEGNEGEDILDGGIDSDLLYGNAGNDILYGREGDDIIDGGSENDQLYGNEGNDKLYGQTGNDFIQGNAGEDYAEGGSGRDFIQGNEGEDILYGQDGSDTIEGNADDDFIDGGNGQDLLFGNTGDDRIYGQAGNDVIQGNENNDWLEGGDGQDIIDGGADDDDIYGQAGEDNLFGSQGQDYIDGGDGKDTLFGGFDDDVLLGQAGDDTLNGNAGNDELFGGTGNDSLIGEIGDDLIDGGEGIDLVNYINSPSGVIVNIDENSDYDNNTNQRFKEFVTAVNPSEYYTELERDFEIAAGTGKDGFGTTDALRNLEDIIGTRFEDILIANEKDNRIWALEGNDLLIGNAGNDSFYGGEGIDILSYRRDPNGVTVNLQTGDATDGWGNQDKIADIENVAGSRHDDNITGDDTVNVITGDAGDERIDGLDGNDQLYGEFGNDLIYGGEGGDSIYGNQDRDTLYGEAGQDYIRGGDADDLIYAGSDDDTVAGDAGYGNDTIFGETGKDLLYGGAGDDFVYGGEDKDTIYGEGENDKLYGQGDTDLIYGGTGDDELSGGYEKDTLIGEAGNDTLAGDAGDDTLDAGTGNDYLYGGTGKDTLNAGLGNDQLYGGEDADILLGDDGDDNLFGDAGDDTLDAAEGNDNLYGGDGKDILDAGIGNDQLWGGQDDDTLYAKAGDDNLFGEAGDDILDAAEGNDSLYGGDGKDILDAGIDNDYLWGGQGDDTLSAQAGNDYLYGENGDDILDAGEGNDSLYGGDGKDILDAGIDNDYLWGGQDDDTLSAQAGDDYLFGENGDDILDAGEGNDSLYGGDG